ncbi:MAG: hypothetical protein LBJ67_15855 [Planctomycetaceae bacterium]|jgi:WD40 repeat protein|nr:hypothetical protein [Planctomycetaceae bacterium]
MFRSFLNIFIAQPTEKKNIEETNFYENNCFFYEFPFGIPVASFTGRFLRFSPDETKVLLSSFPVSPTTFSLYDIKQEKIILSFQSPSLDTFNNDVHFDIGDEYIAFSINDQIEVFNINNGKKYWSIRGKKCFFQSSCFMLIQKDSDLLICYNIKTKSECWRLCKKNAILVDCNNMYGLIAIDQQYSLVNLKTGDILDTFYGINPRFDKHGNWIISQNFSFNNRSCASENGALVCVFFVIWCVVFACTYCYDKCYI